MPLDPKADAREKGGGEEKKQSILNTPAECTLVIDGRQIKYDIARLEIKQTIDGHHIMKLRAHQQGQISAAADFADQIPYADYLGKSVSITIKPTGGMVDAAREHGFIGVITQIDLDNSIDALNQTMVTAASPTVSMDGAEHNVFYRDQSASDIIGAILRKHPLTLGKIESSSGTLAFSVQYRETDYEYVMRLAASGGLFALYDGKEFRVVKANSSNAEELVWRESLGAFSVGLGTAPAEFNARVYNYEQKKTYTQDTASLSQQASLSNLSRISPEASKKIFSESGFSAAPAVVDDAQSLDGTLQKERLRAMGRMIVCKGQSNIPRLSVGRCAKIKGMKNFDGMYWVTAVTHIYDDTGYYNTFQCTPVDIAYPAARSSRKPATHLQMAVVVDNNDPDKLGRIKVKFPWNESDETPWVRLAVPHAGDKRGWLSLPEIDDEVLIGYEQNNPDLPIALAALYNKETALPADPGGSNDFKVFVTRSGNQIYMSDEDGKEEIKILQKGDKNQIVLQLSGPSITIKSDGGDISLEAKNITIKADEAIKLEGGKDVNAKAGANLKIEASANMDLKASAMMTVDGGMTTVKGQPLQLN